ncbi:MAG: (Fe-S)-binding protein, partial [Acidimicrobiia bacterium]|nr:(Fe-S)-binding protein [Acidimicrobiia bacterium]
MGWVTSDAPTREELDSCVQCGLCLPQCPTYRLTGKETASPRGRLMAMAAVADGVVQVDEAFAGVMEFCLQCRACEVVCPSLVPFGRAMEGARVEIAAQLGTPQRAARRMVVGRFLGVGQAVRAATVGARLLQRTGMGRKLPGVLGRSFGGLRPLDGHDSVVGKHFAAIGDRVGRVGLLAGCVMDPWFGDVHTASIEVLRRAGYDVVVPGNQTCCGALAAHDGEAGGARRMAKENAAAFASVDLIVADAAGCSAHLKEYGHWIGSIGASVAGRARDVTEVVADAIEQGRLPRLDTDRGPVAVQDPCHLRHVQRVVEQPRAILRAAGYRPVEIDPEGRCCGAAGLYSLQH